jgi:alkanesulfonate monooxygenase SsuD/methylene tetrahydromethanopterin reductase-like flavin-dependent oxidoreductase (luciferase family)
VRDYAAIAAEAERLGYGRVWATEAGSADAFALLAACASVTAAIGLATGILPIQTRGPALCAQAAATLQDFSGGRFALGLGVSTPVVVTGWNGLPWDGKLSRLREYVETVKRLLSGETVDR